MGWVTCFVVSRAVATFGVSGCLWVWRIGWVASFAVSLAVSSCSRPSRFQHFLYFALSFPSWSISNDLWVECCTLVVVWRTRGTCIF